MPLREFKLVKFENQEPVSQMTLSTPENKKSQSHTEKYTKLFEELTQKYNFTLKEIKALEKELKNKEFLKLDLESQIQRLKDRAELISNDKKKQKYIAIL